MAEIIDINNHMAKACGCGCPRFNLLRSGKVECDDCHEIQTATYWRDANDVPPLLPRSAGSPEYSVVCSYTIDKLRRAMRDYVDSKGVSCGLGPIVSDLSLMAMGKRYAIDRDA